MTIALKNANFAKSTLGGNITDVATVLTVASAGDAALFPSTGTMRCVIWSGSLATPMQDTTREFVTMTFSSGVTFDPVVRGRESTSGKAWSTGDCIALVISAGKINELEADINTASGHLDQDVKQASSPTFVGETLSGLTESLPVFTGASKELVSKSVADTLTALFGAWTTPAFNAADFTATGSMTWTVAAGDVITYAYFIAGKIMFLIFSIGTTTVGGTLSYGLTIKVPGGKTIAKSTQIMIQANNNGAVAAGYAVLSAAGTTFSIALLAGGNWAASTNNTDVHGSFVFEIQ
jgi:hypothetical protein